MNEISELNKYLANIEWNLGNETRRNYSLIRIRFIHYSFFSTAVRILKDQWVYS